MRRTLFLIPHEIGGIPVFGVGWLLAAVGLLVIGRIVWVWRSGYPPEPLSSEGEVRGSGEGHVSGKGHRSAKSPSSSVAKRRVSREGGPITGGTITGGPIAGMAAVKRLIVQELLAWIAFAVLVIFGLPIAELHNVAGEPVGMPIRGYGFFLMLAAIGSVSMAAWRAERAGIGAEAILRLAPWTFAGGLFGARMFYVIQYHGDFMRDTWPETIRAMIALTQGGLVVYGGFIGGFLASVWVIRRWSGSIWRLGDIIIPCVFIGLFFGRLGCLMNGCCYGGQCEPNPLSVAFPPGSGVYGEQLTSGELIGLTTRPSFGDGDDKEAIDKEAEGEPAENKPLRRTVVSVQPGSLADRAGIQPGQTVSLLADPGFVDRTPPDRPAEEALPGLAVLRDGQLVARFAPDQLPARANPVWATQIISSFVGAIMFAVLLTLERCFRIAGIRGEGILMLTGFIAYALLRIGLEWLRVDEGGQFGTDLSISQWVSLAVIAVSVIALVQRLRSSPNQPTPDQPTPGESMAGPI